LITDWNNCKHGTKRPLDGAFHWAVTNSCVVIRDPEDSRFDLEAYLNDVAARNK
jgi:hypothetical protein